MRTQSTIASFHSDEYDTQFSYIPIDNSRNGVYNIYTSTKKFAKAVSKEDRSAFTKHLSSLTKDMSPGEFRMVEVHGANRIYFFLADGYMTGDVYGSVSNKRLGIYRKKERIFTMELTKTEKAMLYGLKLTPLTMEQACNLSYVLNTEEKQLAMIFYLKRNPQATEKEIMGAVARILIATKK